MEKVFYSSASRVLSANAIPTTYEGLGVTGIAFGENAYGITSENLNNGLIIDALAEKILTDMGTDVGIESFGEGKTVKYQYFCDDENYIIAGNCTAYDICLSHNCKILSYVSNEFENPDIPFCYLYENAEGRKFLVSHCNAKDSEMLLKHYANAEIIADHAEWLSGKKLPAYCYGNPNLYLQCK